MFWPQIVWPSSSTRRGDSRFTVSSHTTTQYKESPGMDTSMSCTLMAANPHGPLLIISWTWEKFWWSYNLVPCQGRSYEVYVDGFVVFWQGPPLTSHHSISFWGASQKNVCLSGSISKVFYGYVLVYISNTMVFLPLSINVFLKV